MSEMQNFLLKLVFVDEDGNLYHVHSGPDTIRRVNNLIDEVGDDLRIGEPLEVEEVGGGETFVAYITLTLAMLAMLGGAVLMHYRGYIDADTLFIANTVLVVGLLIVMFLYAPWLGGD